MSKSLKNFVTIQDALTKYTARQIRLMFLLHAWNSVLDYKDDSMRQAIAVESTFNKFFVNARSVIAERRHIEETTPSTGSNNHREPERKLLDQLAETQTKVHAALCDNLDTTTAIDRLVDLISAANVYMASKAKGGSAPANADVLEKVAGYVTKVVKVFGCVPDDVSVEIGWEAKGGAGGDKEEIVMPYLRALSGYRDGVRELARAKKGGLFRRVRTVWQVGKRTDLESSLVPNPQTTAKSSLFPTNSATKHYHRSASSLTTAKMVKRSSNSSTRKPCSENEKRKRKLPPTRPREQRRPKRERRKRRRRSWQRERRSRRRCSRMRKG